ncbi:30S ribosomal protein S6 [candidate division LCP-89 bacterium B3_LCP]|uniref:Small ribosomal subunit protein bS6 n=1 Tax=candidate division LCP-89 bacterium B3_LCP TaxID=2012998 RepID=A0A532UZS0_UNCL8|nr:MAG: 30S ribosomal protein S6 [candidate division LCP-89 bacterium B3_LCP]
MKTYELTFIIDAQLAPDRQEEVINKFLDLIKSLGAEILNVEKWGKRKLAYIIDDRQYGYYLMVQFKLDSEALPQIERHLKLSPNIFRHLLLHRDPRTLKLMQLETERLAREAIYSAEKEQAKATEDTEKKAVKDVPEKPPEIEKPDDGDLPESGTDVSTDEDPEKKAVKDVPEKPPEIEKPDDGDLPESGTDVSTEEEEIKNSDPADKE